MYTYKDVKDKTKEGMDKELSEGLGIIAAYFYRTHGLPLDMFKDMAETTHLRSRSDQWAFYMSFRNTNPTVFSDSEK